MARRMERPGVVDQEVDAAVVLVQQLDETVAVGHVGDVHRIGDEAVSLALGLLAGLFELVLSRPQMMVMAPASANLCAAARPMPDDPPVTSTTLPPPCRAASGRCAGRGRGGAPSSPTGARRSP
jgi:hypothetical protein